MFILAASSGLPPGTGHVVLIGAALLGCYAAACLLWPVTTCSRCDGSGKHRSPSGKNWRPCRRCKGTGGRLRIGRRLFNALRR